MFFHQAFAGDLPLQGTEVAAQWDSLYNFLVWLSVFFFVLVVGGMIYLAVKYRASVVTKTKYITDNHVIELIWTIIPLILLMVIFGWGYSVYRGMTEAPSDAMEIRVIARQWMWRFQYDDGRQTTGDLYVPVDKPVKLIMTSEAKDVIHSFFVPNFRIKQDVVPGLYTTTWFQATRPGRHQIFCAEYCGTGHSQMFGKVVVLTAEQWEKWVRGKDVGPIPDASDADPVALSQNSPAEKPIVRMKDTDRLATTSAQAQPAQWAAANHLNTPTSLASQGRQTVEAKGCVACHTPGGESKIGPSFKGLFGRKVELQGGSTVLADENYIRESIEMPSAKIVKGYNPVMPTFKGLLNESEMNAVIAYIKSLK